LEIERRDISVITRIRLAHKSKAITAINGFRERITGAIVLINT